ncbi:hypothetical protein BCV70DRAFT_197565 [Testicularia cyperi]|uniref:Uncharacterized protein n=1 Tax=Testicularia cyperi TaxID=1882483 RepID=A0A317XZH1_9BASI|nr:hypothetical protein BCV70DRAFT_197565 [Testicularia cyperi]
MSEAYTSGGFEPIVPALQPMFKVWCEVEAAEPVGDSGEGFRKIVPIGRGAIESDKCPALDGAQLMPGGSDYFRTDQYGKTRLDARYYFKLKSGHNMYFQSSGLRLVPESYNDPEAKAAILAGKDVEPSRYYFRLKLILETDCPDTQLQDIVNKIIIASAIRRPKAVIYQAYVVT